MCRACVRVCCADFLGQNEGARALASCLIVNSTLQGLNLWKNGQITHIGIEHLIYMLSRNHTFADLNLFKNEYSRPETLKVPAGPAIACA
jgi:hypothetical protein